MSILYLTLYDATFSKKRKPRKRAKREKRILKLCARIERLQEQIKCKQAMSLTERE